MIFILATYEICMRYWGRSQITPTPSTTTQNTFRRLSPILIFRFLQNYIQHDPV
jgi:hypothetical protein